MAEEARKALDAMELLMQDHREIEALFVDFEHLDRTGGDTSEVIALACTELRMHDTLENEFFYPAVGSASVGGETEALLDAAEEAHDDVLDLIDDLEDLEADDATRNALFKLIVAQVKLHITQEETKLFPIAATLEGLNVDSIAAAMNKRQQALMSDNERAASAAESA